MKKYCQQCGKQFETNDKDINFCQDCIKTEPRLRRFPLPKSRFSAVFPGIFRAAFMQFDGKKQAEI